MKSPVVKRSVILAGHKTSVSLEDAFWMGLKEIARNRVMSLSDLVGTIDSQRQQGNLSSALRLFVLEFYRSQIPDTKSPEAFPQTGHASPARESHRNLETATAPHYWYASKANIPAIIAGATRVPMTNAITDVVWT